ncbi:MAG: hypothetical protein KatS3mg008_0414 [Acidimicrobiales bacterium]|nr:MAG: hypothetical protein KatS3mg008_0414 [Acidimicrobiales bacterium]
MSWFRIRTVARHDLLQLLGAKDFWVPMALLGSLFFVVIPSILLSTITNIGDIEIVSRISDTLEILPENAQRAIPSTKPDGEPVTDAGKTSYALAVYLLAPVAIVVPLTISTAVGAATIVGERERGTGEFLAHSPADVKEIYTGKLIAAVVPGYLTTLIGFGAYSIVVNLTVGPAVGGWFFPTSQWWLLILFLVPPFLLLALAMVLRVSARVRSTAAAQQASGLVTIPLIITAYVVSTGALFDVETLVIGVSVVLWFVAFAAIAILMQGISRGRLLGVADET